MFEYTCTLFIGLQYIWEYRSPSKSAPPHYQCKLCVVQQLQNEIAAHITGWKHSFRYMVQSSQSLVNQISQISSAHASDIMHIHILIIFFFFFFGKQKQNHKDKVPHEEEDALKDPTIRKAIKAAAAEVEKAEGRGQIKVKDCRLMCFKDESYTCAL